FLPQHNGTRYLLGADGQRVGAMPTIPRGFQLFGIIAGSPTEAAWSGPAMCAANGRRLPSLPGFKRHDGARFEARTRTVSLLPFQLVPSFPVGFIEALPVVRFGLLAGFRIGNNRAARHHWEEGK